MTKIKAIQTKEIIFSILIFWFVLLAISFFTSNNANAENLKDTDISEGSFSMAKVIFPITDVSQSGNNVSLTIEKNARELESKSQTVDYSVMQKSGTSATKCPLVNSTAIDKQIKGYNPLTGKASLDVTFRTEEQAKKAAAADCLLIKDTEVEGEE